MERNSRIRKIEIAILVIILMVGVFLMYNAGWFNSSKKAEVANVTKVITTAPAVTITPVAPKSVACPGGNLAACTNGVVARLSAGEQAEHIRLGLLTKADLQSEATKTCHKLCD